jgi:hypothetical protein
VSALRIPRESVEKVQARVYAPADPTGDTVEFSFPAEGSRPTVWSAGSWDGSYSNGYATAVGPTVGFTDSAATVELAVGTYLVFVRVTDDPEVPVRQAGAIVIE